MSDVVDVAIVGAGPAGLAAALYAGRKQLKCVLLEGKAVGGAMATTPTIENYPGFESVSGTELTQKMREQVEKLGIKIVEGEVCGLEKKGEAFEIVCPGKPDVLAKTVILATGAEYKKAGAPGEKEYSGKGVSYCASCDGPLFREKRVAVIGGGNTAASSAISLSDIASKVFLVHRRQGFRADEVIVKELKKRAKVELVLDSVLKRVEGDKFVKRIFVENVKTKEERSIDVDGVFIQIGVMPASELAREVGAEITEKGFVKVDGKQRTTVQGVFAAGDCTGRLLQIVWAAAEGAMAALKAYDYINGIDSDKAKLKIEH